jgi:DNA-binding CsgD family transcriptional regulator
MKNPIYYREFLLEQDIRYLCAGVIFGMEYAPHPITGLSLYKGHKEGKFSEADRQIVSLLIGHLSRGLATMFHLGDLEMRVASSCAALDLLSVGVVLIGARGNVVFANKKAHTAFSARTAVMLRAGNPLADAEGWIQLRDAALQNTLDSVIRTTTMHDPMTAPHISTGLSIPYADATETITLQIAPLAIQNEFSAGTNEARAIVFMYDSSIKIKLDRGALQSLYALTDTEIVIAHALLTAESLRDIAAQLGNSENTVKKHVQALFHKTQTNRQAELIRLLLSLPARS